MTTDNDERLKAIATKAAISVGGYAHPGFAPYDAALRAATEALAVFEKAHTPTDDERSVLDKSIWWAVVQECQGQLGGEPHATTWARGGYRNDVPTLCDRCKRLIETLKSLSAFRRSEGVALSPKDAGSAPKAEEPEVEYRISDGEFIHYTSSKSRVDRALSKGLDVRWRTPKRDATGWVPAKQEEATED